VHGRRRAVSAPTLNPEKFEKIKTVFARVGTVALLQPKSKGGALDG
jgi:hypothetical protein